ncbi:MAG TPA: mechanosensitive ion channel domain-containing protein [Hanamia sp.]|nr:mechanosensitive ion channel domain-containing protein [Hanamia sp.]
MKRFSFTIILLFFFANIFGQKKDSLLKRPSASFFVNADTVTRNDYLLSLEKVYQTLNKASVLSQPVPSILGIINNLNDDDSAIALIKERLNMNDRSLNIRNLQMMSIILKQINKDSRSYSAQLKEYDSIAGSLKSQIYALRKDSLLRRILTDSLLKDSFSQQLLQLKAKWQKTDSILKYVNLLIDNSQARTSNNLITTDELQLQAQSLMQSTGSRAFSKESKYLWEFPKSLTNTGVSTEFKKTINAERQISGYYFSHTHNQLLLLLMCGLLFFFWIFYNFKSLEKLGKSETIEPFKFHYINPVPVFASLVVMLNLAPLFDLDAPFIYIATIEFLLMLTLTYSFWKRLPHHLFYLWIFFIVLFLLQSSSRYIGLPVYLNRWLLFILNSLSVLLGLYVLSVFQKDYQEHKFLILSACLYVLFNFLAVLCNVFGRVTLMQILGSTGTYAFIQTAGLLVFIESVTEAFLLQIQSSRMRKEYTGGFDYKEIGKGVSKIVIFFSVIIWLIVFATNLNIYNTISSRISDVLNKARSIGSFTFTYGGVILFILIMWVANFLQRYIGYFFGNIGDDVTFDNKGQRSKLMVVKLVLLVAGFLLAVAASGLAIDKITVILGALSVGIGLGLQNIVNNFVSGIILIFDRTLHIGDTVEIGDKKGRVKQISMRSSTLLTAEGAEVIIPNGNILSKEFVNWSLNDNDIRIDLTFTVSKISKELREGILKIIKESPDVAKKEPEILTNTVTSQSTQLKIYFWCDDVTKREIARSEVYTSVSKYLEEQGVNIL